MCFKNLPVEFDEQGNARLKEGVADPYSYEVTEVTPLDQDERKLKKLLERNGHIRQVDFDPVTRVAGALAFHTVVDLESRQVLETDSMATLFRGYEVILKGRDPRDAIFISSRACGVCGGVHSTTSALALEMAFGIAPPPMGTVARNLLLSLEYLYDHPLHLFLLAGPDFSEPAVRGDQPGDLGPGGTGGRRRQGHPRLLDDRRDHDRDDAAHRRALRRGAPHDPRRP